jgi:predicted HicB family RNase H-like nuclease
MDVKKPEPVQVVTIRVPKSLHAALRRAAFAHEMSMNTMCVKKLSELIEPPKQTDVL